MGYGKIQSQVEAMCSDGVELKCVPHVYPGFVHKLAEYLTFTQKDVDNAWLEVALDVLGRPAMRAESRGDFLGYSYQDAARVSFWFHADAAPPADEQISITRIDDRAAFPPTSLLTSTSMIWARSAGDL